MHSGRNILAAGIMAIAASATTANAAIVTWTGNGNGISWNDADNWDTMAVPGAGDRAVIPNGNFFDVDVNGDFTVDTIEVGADAYLAVLSNNTLTLENDDDNCGTPHSPPQPACNSNDHVIDGEVHLQPGAEITFTTAAVHSLRGTGAITGGSSTAKLTINASVVLVSYLANAEGGIRGAMTFNGLSGTRNGTFANYGIVAADGGKMTFSANTVLRDTAGAAWWHKGCATMQFDGDADLAGDFWSGDPDPDFGFFPEGGNNWVFNGVIRTCGALKMLVCGMGGSIGANGGFEYASFIGNGCPNPGTSGGSISCTNYQVTSLPNVVCP